MSATLSKAALMTVREVARMAGFHPDTIYRALEAGELRGMKAGNGPRARWRIRLEDVETWLSAPNGR